MPTKRLQALLAQLHEEVAELGESSEVEKSRLEALIDEIEANLDTQAAEQQSSFLNGLRARLVEFETEHPTASGVAQRLMQTLSDMGI